MYADIANSENYGILSGNSWAASSSLKVKAILKAEDAETGVETAPIPLQTIAFTPFEDVTINEITVTYKGVITGIDEIEAENDAEAVYYNLQGVRVANPEKGIYIVVKGNKVTKQVF